MNPFRRIILFSALETLTVVLWAALVFDAEAFRPKQYLGIAVLLVGYIIEHVWAWNTQKDRGLFDKPRH